MGGLVGDINNRTLTFGSAILKAITKLPPEPRGWVIAKQLDRAGTSIGANVWEADAALTDLDFANKISIARKEAHETEYWLALSELSKLLPSELLEGLQTEAVALSKILGSIVRKTQIHVKSKK